MNKQESISELYKISSELLKSQNNIEDINVFVSKKAKITINDLLEKDNERKIRHAIRIKNVIENLS
jgi:hypothetical protein